MSQGIKMLTTLTRLKMHPHNRGFIKHFTIGLSSYNKDLVKPPIVAATPSSDYLMLHLKNATSPQKVLELVGSHHKIMNSKQLMQALRSLFSLQKYGNSNLSMQQIIQHSNFDKLCNHLKSQAGLIELNETIEALKIVSFVGVSSNSTIVQVLLQLLRHNINDMTLQHVIFLEFLLRQFKSSPLVDGLLIALPIVFEVHLPMKIDRDNVTHLAEYLQFVSKKPVSDTCIELIVNSLVKCFNSQPVVDVKVAKSVIWSICDMDSDEFYEPLLKKSLNAILIDIDKLKYEEMQTTLTKLIYKYSAKYPLYYDETFFDTCANYIVDNDLGFEEALYTLRKFLRVNHSNENLLNYLSTKCHENSDLLAQASPGQLFIMAAATALTEYKPVHWDIMKQTLLETTCFKHCSQRDVLWIKFASALCALDIYNSDVLKRALDEAFLERMVKLHYISDFENFLLINQAICTFQPELKHLLPSKSLTEKLVSKIKPVLEYPLEGALQKGLGGENYVKTCLKTELGHHIDHVVVMRKGGYPVALSKNVQYIEEIEVPFDSQLILILALRSLHYTNNNRKLKASSGLMIRTLEAKGYMVVPVCMDVWDSLADFEKIPYLMQAIRLKTENSARIYDAVC